MKKPDPYMEESASRWSYVGCTPMWGVVCVVAVVIIAAFVRYA